MLSRPRRGRRPLFAPSPTTEPVIPLLPQSVPAPDGGFLSQLGWVDVTALAVLLVFFVLGLFRGLVWQVSRILTLLLAYFAAGRYGSDVADGIRDWFSPELAARNVHVYLAYVLVFLAVLILIGVITFFVEKLVQRSSLSFYNRLGGGLLGIVTGACVVLAVLAGIVMFLGKDASVARAARKSRSMEIGQRILDVFGDTVPPEIREAFGLPASQSPADGRREGAGGAEGK